MTMTAKTENNFALSSVVINETTLHLRKFDFLIRRQSDVKRVILSPHYGL
jgi:hypothetical protein